MCKLVFAKGGFGTFDKRELIEGLYVYPFYVVFVGFCVYPFCVVFVGLCVYPFYGLRWAIERLCVYHLCSGNPSYHCIYVVYMEAMTHSHEVVSIPGSWGCRHPRSGRMTGRSVKERGSNTPHSDFPTPNCGICVQEHVEIRECLAVMKRCIHQQQKEHMKCRRGR